MSRSFYVDSLIIKDTVRPGPPEHPGQDFLIPLSMHSPSVMSVTAPACPSRKNGTFCVCPLCVTSHIHSSRGGIPVLKSQFPGAEFCQRIAHQQSPALAHPGHTPVCTPTFGVTDPRRYHCLSIGKRSVCRALSLRLEIKLGIDPQSRHKSGAAVNANAQRLLRTEICAMFGPVCIRGRVEMCRVGKGRCLTVFNVSKQGPPRAATYRMARGCARLSRARNSWSSSGSSPRTCISRD